MRKRFFLPITIILCAILFVGWQQFIYEPARREILSMELETRRLRELEREISALKARHGDLSSLVAAKELELDAAQNFLPPILQQDKFIDELYRAADLHRARLISVQTGEIISSKEISAQIINIKLEADYISLLSFIREILDGERLATLEKISLEKSEGKFLSCELNFKIFATKKGES